MKQRIPSKSRVVQKAPKGSRRRSQKDAVHHDLADGILRPSVRAAATLDVFPVAPGINADFGQLVDAVAKQAELVAGGNMERVEAILVAQAHSLDAIFNTLVRRAAKAEYVSSFEAFLKFGLRAQNQCRATLETLAVMKHPHPFAIVRQANISSGPQQVNNGPASRVREIENPENELLELNNGPRLDRRAPSPAEQTYTPVAALGQVDGSTHSAGQAGVISKRE